VPTTSSLAFVNPWFNPINPAAYHPVTSTTRYDNIITLTLGYILLDFWSYNFRYLPLFRLSLRRLYFRSLDEFEDFLRIKDEFPFDSYA
jgi:hypothetical protein